MTDAIEAGARADLLPCPFCGGAPFITDIEPHTHEGGLAAFMPDHSGSSCVECGCGVGFVDKDRESATKRWNTRAAIASGALVPASAVAVKPLVWDQPDGPEGTAWLGHGTDMCQYYIRFDSETASYWMPGEVPSHNDDGFAEEFLALDDAKAAAQADYERRIRSALDLSPACGDYVVVPREPTEEMLDAYWHQTGESAEMRQRTKSYARRYYIAMLNAASRTGSEK